jgi:zinc protease
VVGDIDSTETLSLIEAEFGRIEPGPTEIPDVTTREPEQRGERRIIIRQAGQLGALMVGYKGPDGRHPDVDALDVLSVILGSGKTSRLYRKLTDAGATTYINASASRLRDPGLFYAFAMLAPGHTHEDVEASIHEVLDGIATDGVTDEEVVRAKNQLRAHEAFERDGPYAIASQLNEAIAAGDWMLYTTFQERLESVTADDVRRVTRTYCTPDARTVGYYVPTEAGPA